MTKLTAKSMEETIRKYFDDCNSGDVDAIASWFTPDAAHYFPAGSPFGVFRGARAIGEGWAKCVREIGSWWTVDHVIADPEKREAAIEWTHFKTRQNVYLRGDEWYRFTEDGKISEIRAYYACPIVTPEENHEIGDYPYAEWGYPMAAPEGDLKKRDG